MYFNYNVNNKKASNCGCNKNQFERFVPNTKKCNAKIGNCLADWGKNNKTGKCSNFNKAPEYDFKNNKVKGCDCKKNISENDKLKMFAYEKGISLKGQRKDININNGAMKPLKREWTC